MEDLIMEIKKSFEDVRKIKCEECRYRAFTKKLDTLNYSNEILNELHQELVERNEYENNKWTKILKPIFIYFIIPLLVSLISGYFVTLLQEKNYGQLIFISAVVFYFGYLILAMVRSVLIVCDVKRNNHFLMLRFLQRYMREKRINARMSKEGIK